MMFSAIKGTKPIMQNTVPFTRPNDAPTPKNGAVLELDLNNGEFLSRSYYSVEEPFIVAHSIPQNFNGVSKEATPVKQALNLFNTFEEASAWAQKINKELVIIEIKPVATCKPQMASIEKITKAA